MGIDESAHFHIFKGRVDLHTTGAQNLFNRLNVKEFPDFDQQGVSSRVFVPKSLCTCPTLCTSTFSRVT